MIRFRPQPDSTPKGRRQEMDDRGTLATSYPKVSCLDLGRRERKCRSGVSASRKEVVEQVRQVFDALFLDQVHGAPHRQESGAANMLSANGTT